MKVRIAYVEDHRIVREGVNYLLSQHADLEVITDEINWDKIDEFVSERHVNFFILDLQLNIHRERKELNGFAVCELLRSRFPEIKLLAHSMFDSIEHVNRFFAAGGNGFISKKSGHQELYGAIKKVFSGQRYVCPEVIRKSKNAAKFLSGEEPVLKTTDNLFTPTESSVLEKIARGFSTKQIAHQLKISEKTVETHRKHLFDKARVKNVAELIAFAYSKRIFME